MARLILLNGAPGCGKHSLARLLVGEISLAMSLNVDDLHHSLGRWSEDPAASRRQARLLTLAAVREQLASGHDIVVSQYVLSTEFVEELEAAAGDLGATFHEVILVLDAETLATRLAKVQAERPHRLEHVTHNRRVSPADAPALVDAVNGLLRERRRALRVDAAGTPEEILARVWSTIEAADDNEL